MTQYNMVNPLFVLYCSMSSGECSATSHLHQTTAQERALRETTEFTSPSYMQKGSVPWQYK